MPEVLRLVEAVWVRTADDDLIHVSASYWSLAKTLCGKAVVKQIAVAIPEPKIVDCPECLAAGAYNAPRPEGGYTASTHHAWRKT